MYPTSRAMPIAFAALVAFFCFSSSLQAVSGQGSPKIKVNVYYESLCPDSVYFITKQLAPAYNRGLKNFLNVSFIPFGKASWYTDEATGATEFTCQHGESECQGNRAQACVLNKIEGDQQAMVNFVDCAMAKHYNSAAVPECLKKLGYDSAFVADVQTCSKSKAGDDLLIEQGIKTQRFKPRLSFVPSVVVNGEDKSDDYRNFAGVICSMIPSSQHLDACSQ